MKKRSICPNCGFIEVRCLCSHVSSIDNNTQLIILQHPSEISHPLNTVKLMKLCFENIKIFVGEDFTNHDELNLIIENNLHQIALLYPEEQSNKQHESSKLKTLIILDGTWRKTFKIFSLSSNLHSLPRISFKENFESLYRIRNSSKRNSLSTLEATNLALKEIEPTLETGALNNLFIKMINFQIDKMGDEIFHKNYSKKKGSD